VGAFTVQEFHFADFTLDHSRYRLQRGEDILRLEKRPMELLILLVERRGELVSREDIAERLWGKDVFLDVDRSINTAISKVRVALRDDPEKPRFVETVVGKGYRFAAPVICNGDSNAQVQPLSAPVQVAPSSAVVSTERKPVSMRPRVLLGGVAVLALFIVTLVMSHDGSPTSTRQPAIKSLAVLPLKNLSGDPAQEYLADGMTEALIGRLSSIRDLRVISRTSAMLFKDTRMSLPEIAKTLHVDAIVEGSVIREGSRIRVTAQLIRGSTDEHFWSETYDRELREVLALESDVAQSIARKVEVTVTGEEHERLTIVRPISPEVYEDYLRGRFALANSNNRTNAEQSIAYFNEAIRKDPTFAPSYVGLANAYSAVGTVFIGGIAKEERPRVIAAARRALELDPELVEAHVLLGNMARQQWRWAEAETAYRRALELSPNNAEAYSAFASWLVSQGRTEEAVTSCRRARELDPLAVSGSDLAWMLFYARRYDDAVQELRSVLAVTPDDALALWILGFALIANHHSQEAVPVLEKGVSASDRSPAIVGLLVYAYAHAGRRADALRLLEELKRRKQMGYVPAAAFVKAYLGLGEYDRAFFWLEEAYKEQSNLLQFLKVHPIFDPVRDDPRFADLVRRVGLAR